MQVCGQNITFCVEKKPREFTKKGKIHNIIHGIGNVFLKFFQSIVIVNSSWQVMRRPSQSKLFNFQAPFEKKAKIKDWYLASTCGTTSLGNSGFKTDPVSTVGNLQFAKKCGAPTPVGGGGSQYSIWPIFPPKPQESQNNLAQRGRHWSIIVIFQPARITASGVGIPRNAGNAKTEIQMFPVTSVIIWPMRIALVSAQKNPFWNYYQETTKSIIG